MAYILCSFYDYSTVNMFTLMCILPFVWRYDDLERYCQFVHTQAKQIYLFVLNGMRHTTNLHGWIQTWRLLNSIQCPKNQQTDGFLCFKEILELAQMLYNEVLVVEYQNTVSYILL